MFTTVRRLCLLLPLFALATLARGAAPEPATLIKFATVAPRNSTWMNIMEELDKEVRTATANRVGFKFYPGGVQGDELDVIRKIKINQIHAAGFTGVGLGAIQPATRILDLPFLFNTVQEVDAVREGMFERFAGLFREKESIDLSMRSRSSLSPSTLPSLGAGSMRPDYVNARFHLVIVYALKPPQAMKIGMPGMPPQISLSFRPEMRVEM